MGLKNILFLEYAVVGLNEQLKTLQNKYKLKKGRRFNDKNITYEIGVPKIIEDNIEFEVSSKIPQDELSSKERMKQYFDAVKGLLLKSNYKPASVKMENIIWDADKDTEKSRDYVKVNYRVVLQDLYSENEVAKQAEKLKKNPDKYNFPIVPGITSLQGRILLHAIKESIQKIGGETIRSFIEVNEKIRKKLCKSRG
ncbi:MAG: hypothetical protein QF907_09285 [Nitrospinota bacterium]|jgi:hypothetical protein|nr:hypothetical protein [Nitrospinota bacterium]MDP7351149.1 hypothetical protein [Nitrospinota bacterium]MDP7555725.1 hypothetical protein [Nitrospinota bacterium]MDP7580223.1 hypothetical protein [Nitrospinota bacterium]HJN01830.1 hypothetical protein [Nitrospinota bacterium]|tara:strand:- start:176 stop:766 length:591 start_codon:yes stop_codon:yes gene_type:complete